MQRLWRLLAPTLGGLTFCVMAVLCAVAVVSLPVVGEMALHILLFFEAPTAAVSLQGPTAETAARPGRPGLGVGNSWWEQSATSVPSPEPTAPPPLPTTEPTPTPAPSPTVTPLPSDAPKLTDPGKIRAEQFGHGRGAGFVTLSAGSIKNMTNETDAALRSASSGSLPFTVEKNSREPQVLIMHTHATETYQTWQEPVYDRTFTARTDNTALNMCAVGAAMERVLDAAGINTLHDETLYDNPSYTESYDRSAAGVRATLAKHPSIKIVLDVHRDAVEDADGTRVKPLCELNGEATAQVMIIVGCDNGTTAPLPNWRLNLRFAAAWEAAMEGRYPGLTRPILCAYRYYNQDLTTGSILVEVGGHANTLAEAVRAGEYAAGALAQLLGGNSVNCQ